MNIRKTLYPLLLCFVVSKTFGQLTVTPNQTAAVLSSTLASPGITISNPTLTCHTLANGTFNVTPGTMIGTATPFPISNGIILSTGRAANTAGTETFLASTNNSRPGDPALTTLAGGVTTFDACTLEFDITPKGDTVKFNYVFGSEEYINSTCGPYNDAFAFFISGPGISGTQNMALVPGTNIPVTVNSVNSGVPGAGLSLATCTSMGPGSPFTSFYMSNVGGTSFTYRGYTTRLTAVHDVLPCNTYHLKLTVADAGNSLYDSGVFIEAGSLTTPNITGILTACVGATTSLSSAVAVGTWSSSDASVATVGASSGVVTGVTAGTSTITYSMGAGCYVTAEVTILPLPNAIAGPSAVCAGANIILTNTTAGGTWSSTSGNVSVNATTGMVNGISGGTAIITYTDAAGCYTTKIVTVHGTTPITGTTTICQYFTTTLSNTTSGGTWSSSNPGIASVSATGVVYGASAGSVTITYVLPTSCPVTTVVNINPKPAVPAIISPVSLCQYIPAPSLSPMGVGLTWYGPYYSPGVPSVTPNTDTPGSYHFYVTQTSPAGCKSDSGHVVAIVNPKPAPPTIGDVKYCQNDTAVEMTAIGSNLKWYSSATSPTPLSSAPVPSTTYAGLKTWFVTQTINGCESDRADGDVVVMSRPSFKIAGNTKVCVNDSITLNFDGSAANISYFWTVPGDVTIVNGSVLSPSISIQFNDTASAKVITLSAMDSTGQCKTSKSIYVNVTAVPVVSSVSQHDVCINDTVSLALSFRSANALSYTWQVDGQPMQSSSALNIITANSNTGGPFLVRWNKLGNHEIKVQAFGPGHCPSKITGDSIFVHSLPKSTFKVTTEKGKPCLEDSVYFEADTSDYNYSYTWSPEHYFSSVNSPKIWGRLGEEQSVITLAVKDPYGCASKNTVEIAADACCQVFFPSAFTPNADGNNDYFRPLFITLGGKTQESVSYHRFHSFRITNRWGQTVYETTNSEVRWDGTFNGIPQDMGVFFYFIKYGCGGKTLQQKGELTLVR